MANDKCHTVKAFDDDLSQIRAMACQTGGLAEMAIRDALEALLNQDVPAAARVVGSDSQIDLLSREIERRCICLIALRAPMADDLRAVLASFQVATLIERIGDCARGIAEQVARVPRYRFRGALPLLRSTAAEVGNLVRSALDSFASQDGFKAKLVCAERDRIQSLNEQLFRDLLDAVTDDPDDGEGSCSLLIVSQKLDRIADDATNIGRVVYFLCTGERYSDRPTAGLVPAEHV
jgi:phosphate transport system protein